MKTIWLIAATCVAFVCIATTRVRAQVDTPTETATATETETPTDVPTATATDTAVPTDTATAVPTDTATAIPTDTATAIPTDTATAIPTDTATAIPTDTATAIPTDTATSIATDTATAIATDTTTPGATATATQTQANTPTATGTAVFTDTPTAVASPTGTATATFTPVPATPTQTAPPTVTYTPTVPVIAGSGVTQRSLVQAQCAGAVPCNALGLTFAKGKARMKVIRPPRLVGNRAVGKITVTRVFPPQPFLEARVVGDVSYGPDPDGDCPLANTQIPGGVYASYRMTCATLGGAANCKGVLAIPALLPPQCTDVGVIVQNAHIEVYDIVAPGTSSSLLARDGVKIAP
jgi:hypothetical protein